MHSSCTLPSQISWNQRNSKALLFFFIVVLSYQPSHQAASHQVSSQNSQYHHQNNRVDLEDSNLNVYDDDEEKKNTILAESHFRVEIPENHLASNFKQELEIASCPENICNFNGNLEAFERSYAIKVQAKISNFNYIQAEITIRDRNDKISTHELFFLKKNEGVYDLNQKVQFGKGIWLLENSEFSVHHSVHLVYKD